MKRRTTSLRKADARYTVLQLHGLSDDGWAVVGYPSGAIAMSVSGDLLFRLSRTAAEAAAQRMNATAILHGVTSDGDALRNLPLGPLQDA